MKSLVLAFLLTLLNQVFAGFVAGFLFLTFFPIHSVSLAVFASVYFLSLYCHSLWEEVIVKQYKLYCEKIEECSEVWTFFEWSVDFFIGFGWASLFFVFMPLINIVLFLAYVILVATVWMAVFYLAFLLLGFIPLMSVKMIISAVFATVAIGVTFMGKTEAKKS